MSKDHVLRVCVLNQQSTHMAGRK